MYEKAPTSPVTFVQALDVKSGQHEYLLLLSLGGTLSRTDCLLVPFVVITRSVYILNIVLAYLDDDECPYYKKPAALSAQLSLIIVQQRLLYKHLSVFLLTFPQTGLGRCTSVRPKMPKDTMNVREALLSRIVSTKVIIAISHYSLLV